MIRINAAPTFSGRFEAQRRACAMLRNEDGEEGRDFRTYRLDNGRWDWHPVRDKPVEVSVKRR